MINKQTIKKMSKSMTYQRGLDLYRTGAIHDYDHNSYIDELGDEITEITARVEGSSYNDYAIEITVNESTSEIIDTYCECPAFENYEGLCKHCVAVLLEYLDKRPGMLAEQEKEGIDQLLQMLGVSKGKNLRTQTGWKRQTSDKLKKVLSQYFLQENAVFLPETKQGQVHLEPYVMYDGFLNLSVKFRIGITQMYVLKNIQKFI